MIYRRHVSTGLLYPPFYNYILNKPHIFTINFNTHPYIVDLSNNTLSQFELPNNYQIRNDVFVNDTSGNIIVNTYDYRNKKFLYQTNASITLECNTYSMTEVKEGIQNITIPYTLLLYRCNKINFVKDIFMKIYPIIKNNYNKIKIKDYHHISSRQGLENAIKKKKSIYLSLSNNYKDTPQLTENILKNLLSFLHDTIEFLVRIQSEENILWIKEISMDRYLDALCKSHIIENKGRYVKEYVIYSFSNDNFFYYSTYNNKYYKTPYIRICLGKEGGWTLHFGSENNINNIEVDTDKLLKYYDVMKHIGKY